VGSQLCIFCGIMGESTTVIVRIMAGLPIFIVTLSFRTYVCGFGYDFDAGGYRRVVAEFHPGIGDAAQSTTELHH
jgi:hypothetical protein